MMNRAGLIHPRKESMKARGSGMTRVEAALPNELVMRIDEVIEYIGFKTREEFIVAAVRRLLDHYNHLISEIPK